MKEIKLRNGGVTQVDDEDFEWLSQWKWKCWLNRGKPYVIRYTRKRSKNKTSRIVFMHREIIKTPSDLITDHIDSNGLNNQKSNLRVCNLSQNQRNRKATARSGYKGVGMCHTSIRARIKINGNEIVLGYFKTFKEAAIAYNVAAIKYFGEFARLNKI